MLFGQGHREQTQRLCQERTKSPEERQQNAEEAHRAQGAPRGALPEKIRICRRLTELKKALYNRAVTRVGLLPVSLAKQHTHSKFLGGYVLIFTLPIRFS